MEKQTLSMIMSLVFLILVVAIAVGMFNTLEEKDNYLLCKKSIMINAKSEKLAPKKLQYECESEINDYAELNEKETFDKIANNLKQCHYLFDYGKTNLFPNAPSGTTICGVCSYNKINLNHDYTKFNSYVKNNNLLPGILGHERLENSPEIKIIDKQPNDDDLVMVVKFTKVKDDFADMTSDGLATYLANDVSVKTMIGGAAGATMVMLAANPLTGIPIIGGTTLLAGAGATAVGLGSATGFGFGVINNIDKISDFKELFFTTIFIGELNATKLSNEQLGCNKVIF